MDIKYVFIAKKKMESNEFSFPVDAYLSVLVIEIIGTRSKSDLQFLGPRSMYLSGLIIFWSLFDLQTFR